MIAGEAVQVLQDLGGDLQCFIPGVDQHARVGEVVDVFRGATEMDELKGGRGGARRGELIADEVLDGLDVVVRALLEGLHSRRRRRRGVAGEVGRHGAERRRQRGGGRQSDRLLRGECQEPGGLDADALADQRRFGQVPPQDIGAACVAAIDRGEGEKGVDLHAWAGCLQCNIVIVAHPASGAFPSSDWIPP